MGEQSESKRQYSISTRLNLALITIFTLSATLVLSYIVHLSKHHAIRDAEEKAAIILKYHKATRTYLKDSLKPAVLTISAPYRDDDFFDPTWMSSTYAVREINKLFSQIQDGEFYYKECAINARNPENEADEYESAFIYELNRDPELMTRSEIREINGARYLSIMLRGETMEESCRKCHDNPGKAPGDLVAMYGPHRSFHRRVGETIAAMSIRVPISSGMIRGANLIKNVAWVLTGLLIALYLIQFFTYRYWIENPLKQLSASTLQLAENPHQGDTMPVPESREFGILANAFNTMSKRLSDQFNSIRKSEAELKSIAENSPDLIIILDHAANFLFLNKTYSGKTPEEVNGTCLLDLFSEADQTTIKNALSPYIEKPTTGTEEFTITTPDSIKRTFHCRLRPIIYKSSEYNLLITATDVSEEKRKEEELQKSEERFRILSKILPVGVFIADSDGKTIYWNDKLCEITGMIPDDGPEDGWVAALHPDDRQRVLDEWQHSKESGEDFKSEYRFVDREGNVTWVIGEVVPETTQEGETPTGVIGSITDITDHKNAENLLRETTLWLTSMFNAIDDGILIVTPERRIMRGNKAAVRILGYSEEELRDLSAEVLNIDHEHYLEFGRRIRRAFAKDEVATFEFISKRKNGEVFPSAHSVSLLKNDSGEPIGIVSVLRDITQQKKDAEELSLRASFVMNNPAPVLQVNHEGNVVLYNPAAKRIFTDIFEGIKLDRLLSGSDSRSYLHPDAQTQSQFEENINGREFLFSVKTDRDNSVFFLYGSDISALKESRNKIAVALQEKEMLLREIHHRVKNNMQIIVSMMRMRARRAKNKEVRDILDDSQERINAMSLVHEKLYRSQDLSRIDLQEYILQLCDNINRSLNKHQRVKIEIDAEKIMTGPDQSIALGIILCELLNNSFKHAFPEEQYGRISITLKQKQDNLIELVFKDDGPGLPAPQNDQTKSMGLKLIKQIVVSELGGSLEIHSPGAEFTIVFTNKETPRGNYQ